MRVSEAEAAGRGLNSGDSVSPLPLSFLSPAPGCAPPLSLSRGRRRCPARFPFPSPPWSCLRSPPSRGGEGRGGRGGGPAPGRVGLNFPGKPRRGPGAAPSAAGPVSPSPRGSGVGRGGWLPFGMVPGREGASPAGPALSSPGRSSRRAETSTPGAPPGWGAAAAAQGPGVCSSEQRFCNFWGSNLFAGWVCGLPAASRGSSGSPAGVKVALKRLGLCCWALFSP